MTDGSRAKPATYDEYMQRRLAIKRARQESAKWSTPEIASLLRELERVLQPDFHVGLLGSSVLALDRHDHLSGDLDVLIYPHLSGDENGQEMAARCYKQLVSAGLVRLKTISETRAGWFGDDQKSVEIWCTRDGKKVDFFYLR